ncbi:uncharacterized protein LOC134705297 [Mytilus trossulus]|uniref:uncharacterized protein LOC134705297 n=1 Tax=Mytilus trossulus TaxID=6551 RepID=UPI00300600E0
MNMADFNYNNFTHEGLEKEKKKLLVQLKGESISKDGREFWAKAEIIQEQYEDPYRRYEYTSRKLFTQFKKEAQTESELKFWTQLEQKRGAYRYPEDDSFICGDVLDEETEDEADIVQTKVDYVQLESSSGIYEAGNKRDNFDKEQDETRNDKQNKLAETATKNQDIRPKTVESSSLAYIHQKEDPTWTDISLKNDIELDIPDKNERKIMEKEEKKKEKITIKLSKADKKRRQKEDNKSKKKQTKDELKKAKKSTIRDFINSLFSCFRK